jgi:hypothetical protein
MSNYPDASPNSGAKKKGKSLKNEDGREGPQTGKTAQFSDKSVGNMPNEGAPELPKKGVIAEKR